MKEVGDRKALKFKIYTLKSSSILQTTPFKIKLETSGLNFQNIYAYGYKKNVS